MNKPNKDDKKLIWTAEEIIEDYYYFRGDAKKKLLLDADEVKRIIEEGWIEKEDRLLKRLKLK